MSDLKVVERKVRNNFFTLYQIYVASGRNRIFSSNIQNNIFNILLKN